LLSAIVIITFVNENISIAKKENTNKNNKKNKNNTNIHT